MKNYGFKPPVLDATQHVFGDANMHLKGAPLTDGHWLLCIPEKEIQNKNGLETSGCSEYGTFNALETLFLFQYGRKMNWAERFIAVLAGNDPSGNDPHKVIETIRKCGLIDDALLPFDESVTSWEKWKSPIPMTPALITEGLRFLQDYAIGHDWVPDNPESIKEALKYSPLGVSVYAWVNENGGEIYSFPPGLSRNHWCALVDYVDKEYWIIFDSYDQTIKKVAWDSKFIYIKRYSITKNTAAQKISLIKQLIIWLQALLLIAPPAPKPTPIEPKPTPKPMNKVYETATALIGKDASPKDLVKDGVGCAESVSTILHGLIPTFPIVTGTWSLWDVLRARPDFMEVKEGSVLEPGDIILCATGTGNGKVSNGHVGILSIGDGIMSNDSLDGIWKVNFTRESWKSYFVIKGGYPVHYFRLR